MRPLMTWLQSQGITSLTFIPCGLLAVFPLTTIPLDHERTVGDVLPTSVAPSARVFQQAKQSRIRREGIYALGNPTPSSPPLKWSEAEALTIAALANNTGLPAEAVTTTSATRDWLIQKLNTGIVVDASCHGKFDSTRFLESALMLANKERLTLAEMLHGQLDLHGLRLLILSACQRAVPDTQGAVDEVHSLATTMLQASAQAVLASLWSVDDLATYLLITRFTKEWLPQMEKESPSKALARAQAWLRTITNRQLLKWDADNFSSSMDEAALKKINVAEARVRSSVAQSQLDDCPYQDPIYWAGFQVVEW